MKESSKHHPLKRVRQVLKKSPAHLGLKRYATSQGFAELIGRSPSAIRTIECGLSKNWENTAELIEREIGVSADWLLSGPDPEEPILDRDRRVWLPENYLDPLDKKNGSLNWRRILNRFPDTLPELIGKCVEQALLVELSLGYDELLCRIVTTMDDCHIFQNPALVDDFQRLKDELVKKVSSQVELISISPKYEVTGAEDCLEILKRNPFGWFNKLDADSRTGWLADADQHYKTVFPHLKKGGK